MSSSNCFRKEDTCWTAHASAERRGTMANDPMKPRISVITLGVNDLETSLAFYRDGLGLPTTGIIGTEFTGDETHPSGAIVTFELHNPTNCATSCFFLFKEAYFYADVLQVTSRCAILGFSILKLMRPCET